MKEFHVSAHMVAFEQYPLNTLIRMAQKFGELTKEMAVLHVGDELEAGNIWKGKLSTQGEQLYVRSEGNFIRNFGSEKPDERPASPDQKTKLFRALRPITEQLFNPALHKCWL